MGIRLCHVAAEVEREYYKRLDIEIKSILKDPNEVAFILEDSAKELAPYLIEHFDSLPTTVRMTLQAAAEQLAKDLYMPTLSEIENDIKAAVDGW